MWHDTPANEPCETWLELDAGRYDTRRIERFADGSVFMASESLNADYLAEAPWPTDAELARAWEDVAFEVHSLSAAQFAATWAWALGERQRGRY